MAQALLNHSDMHLQTNATTKTHSPQHMLNAKVQQVLLSLNRNHQGFNSSNCTCVPIAWRCDGKSSLRTPQSATL